MVDARKKDAYTQSC